VELLFAYLIFYGSASLWISREHFSAGNWIERKIIKNDKSRHIFKMVLELMTLAFVIIFFYYSLKLTLFTEAVTNVLAIPKKVFYSCMPISGAIMIVYSIRNILMEVAGVSKAKQEVVKGVGSQESGVRN
jgi:TRAP-type transport system small permease protein